MKWLRGAFLNAPFVVLATILFGSISVFVSFFDKTGAAQIRIARAWARTLLGFSGIRVSVDGLERIAPSNSYVFVSNHLSFLDAPLILACIPVQFRFLAKRGLFQIPFLGQHLSRAGHIPVPRDDPRAGVKTMQLAAETIQSKRISLLVFPEGGRSKDGRLRQFKDGAAYIAIRAGVPIVPVAIWGTREVLPFGSGALKPGSVHLRILEPVETAGISIKSRADVSERLRAAIARALPEAEMPSSSEPVTPLPKHL